MSRIKGGRPRGGWRRVEAGDYMLRKDDHLFRAVLIDGNWHLRIDGQFKGYFGRLFALKAVVADGRDQFGDPLY